MIIKVQIVTSYMSFNEIMSKMDWDPVQLLNAIVPCNSPNPFTIFILLILLFYLKFFYFYSFLYLMVEI